MTDLGAKEQVEKVHTFPGNRAVVVAEEQTTPGDREQKLYRVWPSSGEVFMGSAEFGKPQSPLSWAAGGASGNLVPGDWEGDSQGCTQPWFSGTVGSGLRTCTGRAGHAGAEAWSQVPGRCSGWGWRAETQVQSSPSGQWI